MPTKILITNADSGEDEMHFELEFLASLTIQERFDMMFQKSNEIKQMLIDNGHVKPVEIIKRS